MENELTLTGITVEHGSCDRCGRELGKVYHCSDGNDYGRKCIRTITGWTFSEIDLKLRQAAIRVERARRQAFVDAEMPGLRPGPGKALAGADVLQTLVTEDGWWNGSPRSWAKTWQEFAAEMIKRGVLRRG